MYYVRSVSNKYASKHSIQPCKNGPCCWLAFCEALTLLNGEPKQSCLALPVLDTLRKQLWNALSKEVQESKMVQTLHPACTNTHVRKAMQGRISIVQSHPLMSMHHWLVTGISQKIHGHHLLISHRNRYSMWVLTWFNKNMPLSIECREMHHLDSFGISTCFRQLDNVDSKPMLPLYLCLLGFIQLTGPSWLNSWLFRPTHHTKRPSELHLHHSLVVLNGDGELSCCELRVYPVELDHFIVRNW